MSDAQGKHLTIRQGHAPPPAGRGLPRQSMVAIGATKWPAMKTPSSWTQTVSPAMATTGFSNGVWWAREPRVISSAATDAGGGNTTSRPCAGVVGGVRAEMPRGQTSGEITQQWPIDVPQRGAPGPQPAPGSAARCSLVHAMQGWGASIGDGRSESSKAASSQPSSGGTQVSLCRRLSPVDLARYTRLPRQSRRANAQGQRHVTLRHPAPYP